MKPHKHAELIKAWADGAEIEGKNWNNEWVKVTDISWDPDFEYRIKPEPKPDLVQYLMTNDDECGNLTSYADRLFTFPQWNDNNEPFEQVRLIRDGETGELKSAEVLK